MKNVIIGFLAIVAMSCSTANIHMADNNPHKSFVRLSRIIHTIVCHEKQGIRECTELQPVTFHASGSIIEESREHSYVLTAGHFCSRVEDSPDKLQSIFAQNRIPPDAIDYYKDASFISNVMVNDYLGNEYFSRLIAYDDVQTDLCIVRTDRRMDYRPLVISNNDPVIGDKVIMPSAPMGIHYPGMVIILDGFYSGYIFHPFFHKPSYSITDMPMLPGSSGAAIMNDKFEIVSVAYATNMAFPFESYGVPLSQIKEFVDEYLNVRERNYFRENLNRLFGVR